MPANIAAHYMAKGQRVLITSKSSEALNVIRDYIAGDDRKDNVVFEDSSPLKKLIISWGDKKEAFKLFSDAAVVLTDLCREGAGQDKKMEKNINERKRHRTDIAEIEKDLRDKSRISVTQLLKDFANMPGQSQDSNKILALEILELCHVNRRVKEIEHKTLVQLAQMIRDEKLLDTTDGTFAFFVEKDLEIALQDEGRRQQLWTWFKNKSSTLREQVKTLRANSRSSDEKSKASVSSGGGGFAAAASSALSSPLLAVSSFSAAASSGAREEDVLDNLQRAGLGTWALQIREAIGRSEDSIDTIVPSEWQLHLVLLSCKHFVVGLSKSVPCASMDNEHIKDRKNSEDELRNKMKEFVGHETLKHAIQRYNQPKFPQKLQEFINKYAEIEKMLGEKGKGKKPKQYYRLEHGLQNLLKDGELMSALPIWIMPSDLVSEILPANIGLFDLVILEEASQSDCQSIPVLLRGKKLIIIGDNKQLSPPTAREEYKKTILDNLGTDLPDFTRDNLLPGKSAFDLFSIAFKGPCTPIWLREHFRCYSCFHFMLRANYFSSLAVYFFLTTFGGL
jgi:hypothetical protein